MLPLIHSRTVPSSPACPSEMQATADMYLARGAVPALKRVLLDERPLHRMQTALRVRQPLHRHHLAAVALHCEREAPVHPLAVDEDGARPARPFVAALLGAGQPDRFTKPVEKGAPGATSAATSTPLTRR